LLVAVFLPVCGFFEEAPTPPRQVRNFAEAAFLFFFSSSKKVCSKYYVPGDSFSALAADCP